MIRFIVLAALIALAGCAGQKLAACHGPMFPLNAGEWQPTPAQLATMVAPGE